MSSLGKGKGIYYVAGAFCLPDLLSRLKWGGRRAQPPQVRRRGAPGGYQTGQGFQAEQSFRRGRSSQVLAPRLQDYPRRTNISSGFKLHPLWQSIYSKCRFSPPRLPSPPYPLVPSSPPVPEQPRAAAGTAAKHRAGLAASQ